MGNLHRAIGVNEDFRGNLGRRESEADALALGLGLQRRDCLPDERHEGLRRQVQADLPGLDAGEVLEIVDEPPQPPQLLSHGVKRLRLGREKAIEQPFQVAGKRRQGVRSSWATSPMRVTRCCSTRSSSSAIWLKLVATSASSSLSGTSQRSA